MSPLLGAAEEFHSAARLQRSRVGGAIFGNGILDATNRGVINGGYIQPGLSPGKLTIEGNDEQTPAGTLAIEVAGLQEGQFDVLEVTGDVILNGKLEVRFLDGFLPKQGDSVDFLSVGGAVSGAFAEITFPQLAPGFEVDLAQSNVGLRLIARNDATVAEPVLRFTQVSLNAGQLALTWTTTPGQVYRMEATDDLGLPNWTPASTNITADGSSSSMSFDVAGSVERCFRVAHIEPP